MLDKIKKRFSETLLVGLFSMTEENRISALNNELVYAKKLSDFSGLIVRAVFLNLIWKSLLAYSMNTSVGWTSFAASIVWIFCALLYVCVVVSITRITILYFSDAMMMFENKFAKMLCFVFPLFLSICLMISMNFLADKFVETSPIITNILK